MQSEIIDSVLQGHNTLALLPTGGGKSLCYQVPAMCTEGLTLVITPLIALMHEQVEKLKEAGIRAEHISSGLNRADLIRILNNAVHGAYNLLYLSPERLQTSLFNEYLPAMNISIIAVDEAHCVSQWGHDFRPDYLKIATLKNLFKNVPVIAVTASATENVQADIIAQLQLKDAHVFKQSFERANIFYNIQYSEQKHRDLLDVLAAQKGCTIVYCRSRKQTELLCKQLQQDSIMALPYHAGMTKEARQEHQQKWTNGEVSIIVATTAFGMGIDKSNVRAVIHYDAPEHLEAYYQESGRAGRDGQPATSLLLYNQADINRLEESTVTQFPPFDFIRQVYQSVAEYLQLPIGTEPYRYFDFELADFCARFKLPAFATARALKLLEQEGLWTLTDTVFAPTTVHMLADRHETDSIGRSYPELGVLITTLLRLYGTLYYHPTVINTKVVAKHLRVRHQIIAQLLIQLDKMEILEFNQPKNGSQLFFHHYRVDSKQLIINTDRINALKKAHEARTNAMIQFITNTQTCRTHSILHYFGEIADANCGHCDYCNSKHQTSLRTGNLQAEILQQFSKEENINIHQIIAALYKYPRESVTDSIREMIDNKVLGLKDNTILYKK